ncbi:AfsR/SARP family transcriptional regulator [Nonomuraea rubra]|uniref:AfsR/SARP family transcriptional regulator n=1 Tax=Nonomuraea rubra TaxID=46180 RepID=UPI0033DE9366
MSEGHGEDVRFEVLGPLRAWRARTSLALGSGRRRTLLAVLLLHANRPVSRDRLIDELWGGNVPAYAVNLLQKHMSSLRAGLEPGRRRRGPSGALTWTEAGYVLRVPPGGLDLEVFEQEVRRAREAHAAGDLRGASGAYHTALRLWRGPVCDGLSSPFLDMMRDQVAERRIGAIEECMEVDLALGGQGDLVPELRWLVAHHPLRERLHGLLMLALYRSGRQAEALAAFRDARRRLREELGVEPTALLQTLHQRILAADPDLLPLPTIPPPAPNATPPHDEAPHDKAPHDKAPHDKAPHDKAPSGAGKRGSAAGGTAGTGTARTGTAGTGTAGTGTAASHGSGTRGRPAGGRAGGPASSGQGRRAAARAPRHWPTPAQLPHGVPQFVGRQAEQERLDALLTGDPGRSRAVVLTGMAGVGKTALAIHWAHRIRHRFPDGQLYVNLRGFDPTGTPMEPTEAIQSFLDTFAIKADQLPSGLHARAALFRSLLAGRRMLIVLDNARDAEQVRPLLPGAPGCLVVVTSRDQLTGLVVAEGAHAFVVDLLPKEEARLLLTRRSGVRLSGTFQSGLLQPAARCPAATLDGPANGDEHRLAGEAAAVDEIVAYCGRLPLALSITIARAVTNPSLPFAALAAELRGARARLDPFDGGEQATNVRAVFSWSYGRLTPPAARLFRLLGLHPGPDFSPAAAASLAGLAPQDVRPLVAELARTNMLSERVPGRFAFHGLLRAYACELSDTQDTRDERRTTLHRLLDHYLHSAHQAGRVLSPGQSPDAGLAPALPLVTPEAPAGRSEARTWFTAEHLVLLAAARRAAEAGFPAHARHLSWSLASFLGHRGTWRVTVAPASR